MEATPIFQSIFGEQWHSLPPVMHKHYSNRPFCDDVVVVEGEMDVEFGWLLGRGYAEEKPLDDNSFRMKMNITHPLFGKMYEYRGVFKVV